MEGTTYVDLFATKGIEYLLVIGFLAALVFFWRFLNGTTRRAVPAPVVARPATLRTSWFELPAHDGSTVSLSDLAGKLVVLWFYPVADTPG